MTHFKTSLIVVLLVFATQNTNAQLLKKLRQRVEKSVERTLERKTEEKTEKVTEKAFDSTFNSSPSNSKKLPQSKNNQSLFGNIGQQPDPASNYSFDYLYKMEVTNNDKKPSYLDYYLTKSGSFMGMNIDDKKGKIVSVIDPSKKALYTFTDNGSEKMWMSVGFDPDAVNDYQDENLKITKTGKTKTVLGYRCEEYKIASDEYNGSVWVTKAINVKFLNSNAFKKSAFNQAWLSYGDGLVMEMTMTDNSKRKKKYYTMRCVALDKTSFNLDSSKYKSMLKF